MRRDITIHNIKKHEETFLDFSDGQMFAFIGKNKSGKSTVLQCLESIALVDNTITDPISRGKESGRVTRTGMDRDGNPITIEWDITPTQSIFRASYLAPNGDTKVISDPKRIRDLIGTYFPITVPEVFEMLKYAEGRKKFIKEYLYACLTADQRMKIHDLDVSVSDLKNKQTENNLFQRRAVINKLIEEKNVILRTIQVSEAEKVEITKLEALEAKMVEVKKLLETRNNLEANHSGLIFTSKDITDTTIKVQTLTDRLILDEDHKLFVQEMMEFFGNLQTSIDAQVDISAKTLEEPKSVLTERIAAGEQKITNARAYKQRLGQRNTALQEFTQLESDRDSLQAQIEKAKTDRMAIIANSPLPSGLSFTEETITLNEFVFDETGVSDAEARIALMELMCSISNSDFIIIGDWSLYDKESRKKILDIAKRNNRMVFGQLVTDDENVDCKTIILD